MATEILGHIVDASATELALHSANVMAKFSNGEAYNETAWIERGRFAVRQTMEGMFELGRALIEFFLLFIHSTLKILSYFTITIQLSINIST